MYIDSRKYRFCFLAILISLFVALFYGQQVTYKVGLFNDLEFYYNSYVTSLTMDFMECVDWLKLITGKYELGIVLIYKLFGLLGLTDEFYVVTCLFLTVILCSLLFLIQSGNLKYRGNISLFPFCLFTYFFFSVMVYFIRQDIAILLIFAGFCTKSRFFRLILNVCALLFHYFAAVLLLLMVISKTLIGFGDKYNFLSKTYVIGCAILLSVTALVVQEFFAFVAVNATTDLYITNDSFDASFHVLKQFILAFLVLILLFARLNLKQEKNLTILLSLLTLLFFALLNFNNIHAAFRAYVPVALYCAFVPIIHYNIFKTSNSLKLLYLLMLIANIRLTFLFYIGDYIPS